MLWRFLVLAAALLAALGDLGWRRIPKQLSLAAATAGLLYHGLTGGAGGAIAALLAGLALGVLLLQLGAIAGGDAKWLAALGAMLGLRLWLWSLEFGFLTAGLIALGQMARRGRLAYVFDDLGVVIAGWREHGLRAQPAHSVDAAGVITAPFALAMFGGVLCALLVR